MKCKVMKVVLVFEGWSMHAADEGHVCLNVQQTITMDVQRCFLHDLN